MSRGGNENRPPMEEVGVRKGRRAIFVVGQRGPGLAARRGERAAKTKNADVQVCTSALFCVSGSQELAQKFLQLLGGLFFLGAIAADDHGLALLDRKPHDAEHAFGVHRGLAGLFQRDGAGVAARFFGKNSRRTHVQTLLVIYSIIETCHKNPLLLCSEVAAE